MNRRWGYPREGSQFPGLGGTPKEIHKTCQYHEDLKIKEELVHTKEEDQNLKIEVNLIEQEERREDCPLLRIG